MSPRKKVSHYAGNVGSIWSMSALASQLGRDRGSELDEILFIGIDFGTTYSGAAWATITDLKNDQINVITSWPGTCRGEEGKAPTELCYEDDRVLWGYTIPPDAEAIRWFKLLLLRDEDLSPEMRASEYLLRGRRILRETEKSATDFVADYLRLLWQHVLETIEKARGRHVLNAMIFHVVITVPAIWRDYARKEMKKAATKSGITDSRLAGSTVLTFAPEPEAAALSSLYESGRPVRKGDVYMICDAGGGTVDLISYRIGDMDPIVLHEAVVGTGGLCGGIFIDEAFEATCKARLGRRWNRLTPTGIKGLMKNEWEYAIKPQFKLGNDWVKEYQVAVPAEAFEGSDLNDESKMPIIKGGRIYFASSDIRKVFAPSFKGIEDLVEGQIRKLKESSLSLTAIVLVGGLGSSPYLHEFLTEKYGGRSIEVLQSIGLRPRTAICRGAIFKGYLNASRAGQSKGQSFELGKKVRVGSTIARLSLGVSCCHHYQGSVHSSKNLFYDKLEGAWKVKNQMEWYLKKGTNVTLARPHKHSFYKVYEPGTELYEQQTAIIYQCEDDQPPLEVTPSVKELCKIAFTVDLRNDQLEDYPAANGRILKRFWFDMEMIPSGASNEFRVLINGQAAGSRDISVEFQ